MGVWIASLLTERWGLTGVTTIERLQSYRTRFVLRIASDQGQFAVKVDQAPGQSVAGSEHVQAEVAAALPAHVPAPLPDRAGALAVVERGQRITVLEDIAGGRPESNVATWHGLGVVLARLHALPPVERAFDIPVRAAAAELWREADEFPSGPRVRELIPRAHRIEAQPAATVHGEVNTSNALRRPNGGALVLVDWDQAGAGPIAVELGYPLLCCFLGEDLCWHGQWAAAFYRGYAEHSETALPDVQQIFDAAVLHALRYVRFGNIAHRWARLEYALAREAEFVTELGRVLLRGPGRTS